MKTTNGSEYVFDLAQTTCHPPFLAKIRSDSDPIQVPGEKDPRPTDASVLLLREMLGALYSSPKAVM